MTIVKHSQELIKYISELNLNFSKPQRNHLLNLISGLITLEGKKNISNLNRNFFNTKNRSNLSRFLTSSPWDESEFVKKRMKLSSDVLVENSFSSNEPIFLSIDDTLIPKSKDSKSIGGMTKLFSHVSGKYEWAHCQVALYGKSKDLSVPLNFETYLSSDHCKKNNIEFKSKNTLAYELIKDLEFTKEHQTYLLMDSWYSSADLLTNALKEGIHSIVPLKSNRKIFPEGIEIQIKKYEELIDKSRLNLVTVKGKDYYTYRYEGNLNGIDNASVLFSYELKDGKLKSPMYILSTDISLSNGQIISYYLNRWDIEVSFRYQKDSLGLDHYEMRNLKGINRYWQIIYLAQSYLILQMEKPDENLGKTILREKESTKKSMILKIIKMKAKGISNEIIVNTFLGKTA